MANAVTHLIDYITAKGALLGQGIVYSTMLMYYAWKRPDTPKWAKRIILGALAYLLAPIDAIPDLTPILGFTDDLGVITFGLITISCYVNEEVRHEAKQFLAKLFGHVDHDALIKIEEKIDENKRQNTAL